MKFSKQQVRDILATLSYDMEEESISDCMPIPESYLLVIYDEDGFEGDDPVTDFANEIAKRNDDRIIDNILIALYCSAGYKAEDVLEDDYADPGKEASDEEWYEAINSILAEYDILDTVGALEDYEHKDWILERVKGNCWFDTDNQDYITGIKPF